MFADLRFLLSCSVDPAKLALTQGPAYLKVIQTPVIWGWHARDAEFMEGVVFLFPYFKFTFNDIVCFKKVGYCILIKMDLKTSKYSKY